MILDINEIQAILPHRYPFLLVDAIEEMERWKRIVGIKNVTINEHFFQGHFPGKPIMPGVLIIESMAQTGGLLLLQEVEDREKKLLYFVAIDDARFRRPVVPGDQLRIEVNVLAWRGTFCKLQGRATRGRRTRRRSHADVQDGRLAKPDGTPGRPRNVAPRKPLDEASRMSEIDPRASIAPTARLGNGVQSAPSPSSATKSNSAKAASSIRTPWCKALRASDATITSIPFASSAAIRRISPTKASASRSKSATTTNSANSPPSIAAR